MARDFANTAGSPNIDYVTYSGVPPVAGLGTCSIVLRIAGDSDAPSFGGWISVSDAANVATVSVGRESTGSSAYLSFRNGSSTARQTFPFTFDGTTRSVVVTFDGSASPKTVAYVNGVSQTLSGGALTNTKIGAGQNLCVVGGVSGYRHNGRIADAAIYNRVITPDEALMHSAGYSCRNFPRGMIFYAPLIREVHDIAGGLTGTITGTTVSDHPRIYA